VGLGVLVLYDRGGANKWASPRSYWISIQHPVYGFPRISVLGFSVNRGNILALYAYAFSRLLTSSLYAVIVKEKLSRRGKREKGGARNALPHHVGVASIE
jgi:hypothetical protein